MQTEVAQATEVAQSAQANQQSLASELRIMKEAKAKLDARRMYEIKKNNENLPKRKRMGNLKLGSDPVQAVAIANGETTMPSNWNETETEDLRLLEELGLDICKALQDIKNGSY